MKRKIEEREPNEFGNGKEFNLKDFEYQTFKKKKKKTTIFKIVFNVVNVSIYIVGLVAVFRYLISLF